MSCRVPWSASIYLEHSININLIKLQRVLKFSESSETLANSPSELQDIIQTQSNESKKVGLYLNAEKTKIMTNGPLKRIEIDNSSTM